MSEYLVRGKSWDTFEAYLFDIDGTLLNCADAIHYFAFCDALRTISGRELNLEGVTAHGNTDVGILRDALRLAGIPDAHWRPRLREIVSQMGAFVEQRKLEVCASALPRVRHLLTHLRNKGATLGVATGNVESIGRVKLQKAELMDYFSVAAWSDNYEYRSDVFRHAINLMHAATGRSASICVLGDTPADVLAARANGLPVIAVATGVYSQEQLLATSPDLCLPAFDALFARSARSG